MPVPTLPTWTDLRLILPEIWLVIGMCAVILVPFVRRRDVALGTTVAIITLVLAAISAAASFGVIGAATPGVGIRAMLAIDPFSQTFKVLLCVFTLLVVLQWLIAGRYHTQVLDVPDFLCLLLGATLGMSLMASANNLLMIFVATESASFPSFALAGFRKRHRVGSEGALKYVLFGAAASAVMIYGMSLIYGLTGSLALPAIARHAVIHGVSPLLAVGLLGLFVGIAFKLSAVPMHFWCPDVFEGAPIEVTTFLSVASKGAAIILLTRVLFDLGGAAAAGSHATGLAIGIGILGAVTATWGNLVAFHQNNIKRLLAYSSIAHAGYMIMAASVMALVAAGAGGPHGMPQDVAAVAGAILFYLLVYLFMNLGAFTVAAMIAGGRGSEDIRDYAGLTSRAPLLAVLMAVFLLSLFGMPGLGGFLGKIFLMKAMTAAGAYGFILITVLLINTLISLYYYMRPCYYMFFVPAEKEAQPGFMAAPAGIAVLVICAVALVWTGLNLGGVSSDVQTLAQLQTPQQRMSTADKQGAGVWSLGSGKPSISPAALGLKTPDPRP